MNYIKMTKNDIANGPGIRVVLWVSGCRLHCYNCQNQSTWDFDAGEEFTDETMCELLEALDKPWISGLTLSGGHPLEYENLPEVYRICKTVKQALPDKSIWLYTGYALSVRDFDNTVDICCDNGLLRNYILTMCDVVVDGSYVDKLRDISLKYRGSKNQRLVDVKKTVEHGEIITLQENDV